MVSYHHGSHGTFEWNTDIVNVIVNNCRFPTMTGQEVCCERKRINAVQVFVCMCVCDCSCKDLFCFQIVEAATLYPYLMPSVLFCVDLCSFIHYLWIWCCVAWSFTGTWWDHLGALVFKKMIHLSCAVFLLSTSSQQLLSILLSPVRENFSKIAGWINNYRATSPDWKIILRCFWC